MLVSTSFGSTAVFTSRGLKWTWKEQKANKQQKRCPNMCKSYSNTSKAFCSFSSKLPSTHISDKGVTFHALHCFLLHMNTQRYIPPPLSQVLLPILHTNSGLSTIVDWPPCNALVDGSLFYPNTCTWRTNWLIWFSFSNSCRQDYFSSRYVTSRPFLALSESRLISMEIPDPPSSIAWSIRTIAC